ncbi:MAG: hypothetical protein Alis3KO_25600 [Aliiglaciecola sp.]
MSMHNIIRVITSFSRSFEVAVFNAINTLKNRGGAKIKLVGIAKDEAAYIPDWVHHHLYFGVAQVEIWINNTNDNSAEIISDLRLGDRLKVKQGDVFFRQTTASPQTSTYLHAFRKARREGFSHVLFLDLDEFWVPRDFSTKINNYISDYQFDIMGFEWSHKVDDEIPFNSPFRAEWQGLRVPQVKVLVSTKANVKRMNAHNVLDEKYDYVLADGAEFKKCSKSFSSVNPEELSKPIKGAFIMHRSNRSQLEYVAGLSRGNPVQPRKKKSTIFKDNRSGYLLTENSTTYRIPTEAFERYEASREQFYRDFVNIDKFELAKRYVVDQKDGVIELIRNAAVGEANVLHKILKNVQLEEVIEAYQAYKKSCKNNLD